MTDRTVLTKQRAVACVHLNLRVAQKDQKSRKHKNATFQNILSQSLLAVALSASSPSGGQSVAVVTLDGTALLVPAALTPLAISEVYVMTDTWAMAPAHVSQGLMVMHASCAAKGSMALLAKLVTALSMGPVMMALKEQACASVMRAGQENTAKHSLLRCIHVRHRVPLKLFASRTTLVFAGLSMKEMDSHVQLWTCVRSGMGVVPKQPSAHKQQTR